MPRRCEFQERGPNETVFGFCVFNEQVRERYRAMGAEIVDMSPSQFASYVRADLEKWRKVAREGNIVVE